MMAAPMMLSSKNSADSLFGPKKGRSEELMGMSNNVIASYLVFLGVGALVWHLFSDQDFSVILTVSVMLQGLAFGLLALQIHRNQSAAGLSAKTLMMYAAMIVLRLSSTLWLNGYLPVDTTGDHVYQLADIFSLGLVAYLLRTVFLEYRGSYQEEADGLKIQPIIIGCFVAAVLVHPSMNHYPLFDILWTTSLYIDSLAMVPQLWLMAALKESKIEGLTGHFIALMALSRALSGLFWFHGLEDVGDAGPTEWNHEGWTLVGAHVVMLVLLGDFLFYYAKACFSEGGFFSASKMEMGAGSVTYDV